MLPDLLLLTLLGRFAAVTQDLSIHEVLSKSRGLSEQRKPRPRSADLGSPGRQEKGGSGGQGTKSTRGSSEHAGRMWVVSGFLISRLSSQIQLDGARKWAGKGDGVTLSGDRSHRGTFMAFIWDLHSLHLGPSRPSSGTFMSFVRQPSQDLLGMEHGGREGRPGAGRVL